MNARTASRLSLALLVFTIVLGVVVVATLAVATAITYGGGDVASPAWGFVIMGGAVGVSLLGRLIVARTRNVIGWAFQVIALAAITSIATELIIQASAEQAPSTGAFGMALVSLPSPETGGLQEVAVSRGIGVELAGWLNGFTFLALVLPIPLIFLVFPTGRSLTPRWRWMIRLWGASVLLATVWNAFKPGNAFGSPPSDGGPAIDVANPFAIEGVDLFFQILAWAAGVAGFAAGVAGVVALVLRFRRARGDERAQMKWLALVASAAGAIVATNLFIDLVFGSDTLGESWVGSVMFAVLAFLLLVGVPAAVAIAILKYRLYDVDVVINKAVVYSTLALFIAVVYVGLVVGVGSLLGAGDEPNVALRIAATALVAVAFHPVRERAQRFANRIVYGRRTTPYEVLSGIARRAGETYATDEVLTRMARIIAEGTGASRVAVWLRSGDGLVVDASWPEDGKLRRVRMADGAIPGFDGVARAVEIRHQDELLGAITVEKPRGEALTHAETRLLDDLASHAGLVLRNVGLTKELRRRLEEVEAQAAALTASRQRIVAAQDSERRRLERNIHDGAQQHLVALAVKLRLARSLAPTNAAKARDILEDLQGQLGVALDTLIDLARGIYPPLLEEQGLAAALAAQYLRSSMSVTLVGGAVRQYPIEVAAAAYFCILEALQNAAKYANANHVRIELGDAPHELAFKVIDDGIGFDPAGPSNGTGVPGMSDRVGALGGELLIDSSRGRGTTVAGRIPVLEPEPAR